MAMTLISGFDVVLFPRMKEGLALGYYSLLRREGYSMRFIEVVAITMLAWFAMSNPSFAICIGGMGNCDAEKAAQALRDFGIVGKWSYDCANDKLVRVIFSDSPPRREMIVPAASGDAHDIANITSASRITAEKLKMTSVRLNTIINGKITDSTPVRFDALYLKESGKIRLLEGTTSSDGQTTFTNVHEGITYVPDFNNIKGPWHSSGNPSGYFEQCLN
jgi:hypothetical protein